MQKSQKSLNSQKNQGVRYGTYRWKKVLMKYTIRGAGAPLLVLHDVEPGSGQWEWQELIYLMSQYFTVYAPDLPGYGHSSQNEADYGNFLYVMLVKDFVEDVIKSPIYFVGAGRGAAYGAMACHFSPNYYEKLLLIAPHGADGKAYMPQMRDQFVKWLFEFPIIGTAAYCVMAVKDGFWKHKGGKGARMAASAWYSGYLNLNFSHKLRTIKAPFLIVQKGTQSEIARQCKSFFLGK